MYLLINPRCLIITERNKRELSRLKKTKNQIIVRLIIPFNITEINKKIHSFTYNITLFWYIVSTIAKNAATYHCILQKISSTKVDIFYYTSSIKCLLPPASRNNIDFTVINACQSKFIV